MPRGDSSLVVCALCRSRRRNVRCVVVKRPDLIRSHDVLKYAVLLYCTYTTTYMFVVVLPFKRVNDLYVL